MDRMNVEALDHVNIITDRLDETADFYANLLGLERRDAPPPLTPETATWMFDSENRAIIHINSTDCYRAYDREVKPGELTGALHHVALKCTGYEEVLGRLKEMGAEYQENLVSAISLRQIFTPDPNNVLLELNFFAD
ncbi:MAG TPA: VOC family protein [Sphingomonadaceae bacterium]|nr:VOC family protein [Sphingomonadaceae bacterium]